MIGDHDYTSILDYSVYGVTLAKLCAMRSMLHWNTECFATIVEMGRVAFKARLIEPVYS